MWGVYVVDFINLLKMLFSLFSNIFVWIYIRTMPFTGNQRNIEIAIKNPEENIRTMPTMVDNNPKDVPMNNLGNDGDIEVHAPSGVGKS